MSNTIKHILTSPVTLGGVYQSPLTITSAGGIEPTASGATALYAPSGLGTVHILNEGIIVGGAGAYGAQQGQAGGIGVDLASIALMTNTGTIEGGAGGGSVYYAGNGGDGLILAAGGTVVNEGTITAGAGGADTSSGKASQSSSGDGGIGVSLGSGGRLNNTGTIAGGQGGLDRLPSLAGNNGGYGVNVAAGGMVGNSGTITGGAGGTSGTNGASAGAGGAGVLHANLPVARSKAYRPARLNRPDRRSDTAAYTSRSSAARPH